MIIEYKTSFKEWVEQHNPELDWDWEDPEHLKAQLIQTISEGGTLDLTSIFRCMFAEGDPGLTVEQNDKFLEMDPYQ